MNTLGKWLQDHTKDEREALACSAKTSVGYLYQLAGEHRTPSMKLAMRIQAGTNGEVPVDSYVTDEKEDRATAA